MISSKHRFIYLHVPKTGGNSIQDLLLPFSDDTKCVVPGAQDGVERYEVRGPITPAKHVVIATYASALPSTFRSYRIVISLRHPFDRALSMYFSPHRWQRKADDGRQVPVAPSWDREAFLTLCGEMKQAAEYLLRDGKVLRPHHVIRYENLAADFDRTAAALGLPVSSAQLPHLNRSADTAGLRAELAADAQLREEVAQRFKADMQLMDFAERAAPAA